MWARDKEGMITVMNEAGKMTACVLHGIRDLRVEQVDIPKPEIGRVVVKIRAAGICGSDVDRVYTKGTYHYPTIIGHEFAGEVVDTCEADRQWLGKRVAVFPLIPCMRCAACLEGRYAQCRHYDYYGSRCDGGFTEYLAVNTWNLMPIPDTVSYESAAMFEPAAVAVHALRQAGELFGRSVAIFGGGTIGLILAQIAQNCGCNKIILVVRSKEKMAFARSMGLENVINSQEESVHQRVHDLTAGLGVDVVVEGCGKSATLNDAIAIAASFGVVICMGNPVEDMTLEMKNYSAILRKQLRLCGTWNSSFKVSHNDWDLTMDMVKKGQLKLQGLITDRYEFPEAQAAFDRLYLRQKMSIKNMFIVNEEEA